MSEIPHGLRKASKKQLRKEVMELRRELAIKESTIGNYREARAEKMKMLRVIRSRARSTLIVAADIQMYCNTDKHRAMNLSYRTTGWLGYADECEECAGGGGYKLPDDEVDCSATDGLYQVGTSWYYNPSMNDPTMWCEECIGLGYMCELTELPERLHY
jgi:hypothetical protein